MPRPFRFLTAGGFVLAAVAVLVAATSARAHAQNQNLLPRHAICQDATKYNASRLQDWMNDRLVEGKMGFVTIGTTICTW